MGEKPTWLRLRPERRYCARTECQSLSNKATLTFPMAKARGFFLRS